jgi:hypothetical protein
MSHDATEYDELETFQGNRFPQPVPAIMGASRQLMAIQAREPARDVGGRDG